MDPFSGSSHQPFRELLNSQETHLPPFFSSQVNLSQINFSQESQINQPHPKPKLPEKRRKWTAIEDVVLCSAWLNTSKDAIVSNEQKHNTFWNRVAAYFNASPSVKKEDWRAAGLCKQRWAKINEVVGKFVGAYEAASRHMSSGMNEADIMINAYRIYQQDQKLTFNLEHAWLELRHDQKWRATFSGHGEGSGKRKNVDDEEASSKPDAEGDGNAKPIGVKASKAIEKKKRNKTVVSGSSQTESLEAYKAMWTIKEQDLALKKALVKSNMLDTLLAKTTPLSDLENKLKEKLITEMLNE